QLERIFVTAFETGVLVLLAEEAVAHSQCLDLGSHEAAERVFRGAHDRLAADVEAGVDNYRTTGALLKGRDQRVVPGISLPVNGLDARRVVDVSHRGNVRARNIQLGDSE